LNTQHYKKDRMTKPENLWRNVKKEKPFDQQMVWYYFEPSDKVCAGKYQKTKHGDCFYGEHGFCINEAELWIPIEEYKPNSPKKKE